MEKLHTLKELSDSWTYSERSLKRLIKAGKLRAVKVGPGAVRVPESEVRRYLAEQAGEPILDPVLAELLGE